jgi:prolyl-tRNA editing enzyme YbaK/EbsC (Cys-tRNA(Pro) deacylase)
MVVGVDGTAQVRDYVQTHSVDAEIRVLESSTRNSELAAKALGCSIAEIAKSIVFVDEDNTLVVVLSGDRRVDLRRLCDTVGLNLRLATPEEVYARTGYRVGGVPPFPHRMGVRVIADRSIQRFESVWAAAGDQNSLMRVPTQDLIRVSGAEVVDISK